MYIIIYIGNSFIIMINLTMKMDWSGSCCILLLLTLFIHIYCYDNHLNILPEPVCKRQGILMGNMIMRPPLALTLIKPYFLSSILSENNNVIIKLPLKLIKSSIICEGEGGGVNVREHMCNLFCYAIFNFH